MRRPGLNTGGIIDGGREPLSLVVRLGLAAIVIALHVGGGWALTQVAPVKLVVADGTPMEVRMVSAEATAPPAAPPEPEPPQPEPPLAEPPPPPEIPLVDLATVVDPPPPDLPPPAFPVPAAPPPPPPKPQPPVAKPPPPPEKPRPAQARPPAAPAQAPAAAEAAAPSAPAAPSAGPKTVSASQVGYLVAPNPVYPTRSRRAGEEGVSTLRVLVDSGGQPTQVSVQASSGYPALDESALAAVRAAKFRPYVEAGQAQPVWVTISIRFKLQ